MEDRGQGTPGAGPAVEVSPPPVEAAIDQQIGQIVQATEGINTAQNQQAAEHVEEDLAGQGPDAALEGLAAGQSQAGPDTDSSRSGTEEAGSQTPSGESTQGPQGETETQHRSAGSTTETPPGAQGAEHTDGNQGDQTRPGEQTQEQQAPPETMEQQIANLKERVDKLTTQNETLSAQLNVLIPGLMSFLEKAEAEERSPQKKLKFKDLLLIIAALGLVVVGQGVQEVQRSSSGR